VSTQDKRAEVVPLWTIDDVAAYLRVPLETVRAWRKRRTGPPARRCGKYLRFDPERVRAWFNEEAG
jgi:DNA-binding transcriptional MerR regulator